MSQHARITETLSILAALNMPRAQQNERSALSLLALLDLTPDRSWLEARAPLMGITPVMDWIRTHYNKDYAPNTRETIRRHTMHQFVSAGLVLYNPDDPSRAVNSPRAVYQIAPPALHLLQSFGTPEWPNRLRHYLGAQTSLAMRYARARQMHLVPVSVSSDQQIQLSPGEHSELIREIIEEFAPRFAPGARLIYAGDTGDKWGYFDKGLLEGVGVTVDSHGKMPDVVLFYPKRNWLLLVESVTSHGPVDPKRHDELALLFATAAPGLVFVTAFPSRSVMARYLQEIAWQTEVWTADAPSHLIHFNGERFLGPYQAETPPITH